MFCYFSIDEVKWEGEDIIVMNQVRIVAPYNPDQCQGYRNNSTQAVQHVKKLVRINFITRLIKALDFNAVQSIGHDKKTCFYKAI